MSGNLLVYATRVNRRRGRCALKCARQLPSGVPEVSRAHDMVPVEHGAGPVARDRHRHASGIPPLTMLRTAEVVTQDEP